MLTLAFDLLSQEPDFLTIAVCMPYARISEFNFYYAKPYFLKLTPPGRIAENGSENFYHSPAQRNPWPAF
uniref:SHQ1-like CS domain-containing protein n=1 Tax=Mandrillus leucophaeus TaxID=9568 RepID=A0A2K5Y305_MANLE